MTKGLIIAGGGLVTVLAAALTLRRHRATSLLKSLAGRRGWTMVSRGAKDWLRYLGGVALMQLGHSRRLGPMFQAADNLWLFSYIFETGFEHRRDTHTWRLVVCEIEHGYGRATVTRQDWLIAAGSSPGTHNISLNHQPGHERPPGLQAVVEDPEAWSEHYSDELRQWFGSQPEERSWEFLPGLIVGYEPGGLQETELVSLEDSARKLADQSVKKA